MPHLVSLPTPTHKLRQQQVSEEKQQSGRIAISENKTGQNRLTKRQKIWHAKIVIRLKIQQNKQWRQYFSKSGSSWMNFGRQTPVIKNYDWNKSGKNPNSPRLFSSNNCKQPQVKRINARSADNWRTKTAQARGKTGLNCRTDFVAKLPAGQRWEGGDYPVM